MLEESRKKAAPEKERLLPWLNQTPTADEANHNAIRDLLRSARPETLRFRRMAGHPGQFSSDPKNPGVRKE
jgi:hypothetical protein